MERYSSEIEFLYFSEINAETYSADNCSLLKKDLGEVGQIDQPFIIDYENISQIDNKIDPLYSGLVIYNEESLEDNFLNIPFSVYKLVEKEDFKNNFNKIMTTWSKKIESETIDRELTKNLNQEVREKGKDRDELEKIVDSQIQDLQKNKKNIEVKTSKTRKLIRFLKDLTSLVAADELLNLLRQEMSSFHKVDTPILCYKTSQGQSNILYFQGSDIHEKRVKNLWQLSSRIRVNQKEDSQYLADQFSRPFAKVIGMPLITNYDLAKVGTPPILFFEHDLQNDEVDSFLSFISERLQPLSVALDRILLQFELKNASMLWEKTFAGISDPVAIIDKDFNILRSNSLFSSMEDEDMGAIKRVLAEGTYSHQQIHSKGKVYEVHSYPISLNENGGASAVVNHYVDLTKSHELQSRVVQNEKMAAIGHMAGNIAHELNNPLTGIRSLSQILLSEVKDSEQLHGDLKEVAIAAERCQVIINNLLEFSKNNESQNFKEFSLKELIEKTLPLVKAATRNHSIETFFSDDGDKINVDIPLMQQVIFNLINNACQAMEDGGKIKIETKVDNKFIELFVKDTGCGIPSEDQERVFEPFFTTKEEGVGTGLGLSMVKSVIESFAGTIRVESEAGEGATFRVRLPRL